MKRSALTLLELAVSLVSSIVLVGGLASAVYISSQALPSNDNAARQSSKASKVLCDLTSDVSLALAFSERTPRAITFTVPDRDGDNLVETIRYAWSGTAGDPLTYQYNGDAAVNVATDVQSFNLETITRLLLAESVSAPLAGNVVYEEFTETKAASSVTTASLVKPGGTIEGNLLIAALSLDGNAVGSVSAPAGWNLIHKGPTSGTINQTFSVWWRIATSTEPGNYSFTWSGGRQAYGWVMRFTGHDASNPIMASAGGSGAGLLLVPSPAVTTTTENAMIVRLIGLDNRTLPLAIGLTSLLGHTEITNDRSANSILGCTGAAGYLLQPAAGDSGASTYTLGGMEEYTSVTLAIAPGPAED